MKDGRYYLSERLWWSGPAVLSPDGVEYRFGEKTVPFEEVRDLLGWPSHWTSSSPEVYRRFTIEEEIIIRLTFEGPR